MIAASPHAHCVCVADGNPHVLCWGANGLQENEIRAQLIPLQCEVVEAIAFDGCIATSDSDRRCDGVMVLRRRGQTDLLFVELKNTPMLSVDSSSSSTQPFTVAIIKRSSPMKNVVPLAPLKQQAYLITPNRITPLERSKAERKANGLKITVIPVQRGSAAVPNLRDHLS